MKTRKMLAMTVMLAMLAACMGSTDGGSGCNTDRVLQNVDRANPFAWIRGVLGGALPGRTP